MLRRDVALTIRESYGNPVLLLADRMDGYVVFRNSELLAGQLGKATLGNGNKKGLFAVLTRDYSAGVLTFKWMPILMMY